MFKVKQGICTIISLRGDLSLFVLRNIYSEKCQSVLGYGAVQFYGVGKWRV